MIVLYADDDAEDVDLFEETVKVINPEWQVISFRDGQHLIDFLYDALVLPDLIVLDINMPITDGRACLKFLKKAVRLKHIPVVMYSTSRNHLDELLCFELGAIAYIQKPFTFKEGVEKLSRFFRVK